MNLINLVWWCHQIIWLDERNPPGHSSPHLYKRARLVPANISRRLGYNRHEEGPNSYPALSCRNSIFQVRQSFRLVNHHKSFRQLGKSKNKDNPEYCLEKGENRALFAVPWTAIFYQRNLLKCSSIWHITNKQIHNKNHCEYSYFCILLFNFCFQRRKKKGYNPMFIIFYNLL